VTPQIIDPYRFVVRRFFLELLPMDKSGDPIQYEETVSPGRHESLDALIGQDSFDYYGYALTNDLMEFFKELGFCTFDDTPEERLVWSARNGGPERGTTHMEIALRQLHHDLVLNGSIKDATGWANLRYIPDLAKKLAAWFIALGYPATLDVTQPCAHPSRLP
jgi:uncharacterized protein (DUF3820 family)